jgi:hypothetical protein
LARISASPSTIAHFAEPPCVHTCVRLDRPGLGAAGRQQEKGRQLRAEQVGRFCLEKYGLTRDEPDGEKCVSLWQQMHT